MNNRKNQKGFTIVELLAAVAILAILSTIAIVSVSNILDNANKKHYETQLENMIMATKSFSQENRNILPKAVGETSTVTLETLQNKKYIGKVIDRSKNECNNKESSVTIFKYSKTEYSYTAYLKCGNKEYGNKFGTETIEKPEITLNFKDTDKYDTASFVYSVKVPEDHEGKIVSYDYQIYKYGVLVYDSGNISVSKADKVDEKKVSLKQYLPGNVKIIVNASNHLGGRQTKVIESSINEKNGLKCGEITPKVTDWTRAQEGITISITCEDLGGSGCARKVFTQTFTMDSTESGIVIYDNSGNSISCDVSTFLDRTPPDKPTITNSYEGRWTNQNYSLTIKTKDMTSGVSKLEYCYPGADGECADSDWQTYVTRTAEEIDPEVKEFTFTTPPITTEMSEYIYIRAWDQAGNISEIGKSLIKIDKTSPTCTISRNIPTPDGYNGWYESEVILSMNVTNNPGTGPASPAYYLFSTSSSQDSVTYPTTAMTGILTQRQGDTPTSGILWYGYVKDEAGNTGNCRDASTLYVDTTPFVAQTSNWTTAGTYVFTASCSARYKIEVWGAQGGTDTGTPGKGGYAVGYIDLNTGDKLYATVGGAGGNAATGTGGGYNGGGNAGTSGSSGGGGGASHVAKTKRGSGLLTDYNSYRTEVLIVAGGGGGAGNSYGDINGGSGGGTNGGQPRGSGCQATGSSGYAFGRGQNRSGDGGGGGGGWFGGCSSNGDGGGAGGSGYIGGVLNGSMSNGAKSGAGRVRITNDY